MGEFLTKVFAICIWAPAHIKMNSYSEDLWNEYDTGVIRPHLKAQNKYSFLLLKTEVASFRNVVTILFANMGQIPNCAALFCSIYWNILSRDGVTPGGFWFGNRIYWIRIQLVTIFYSVLQQALSLLSLPCLHRSLPRYNLLIRIFLTPLRLKNCTREPSTQDCLVMAACPHYVTPARTAQKMSLLLLVDVAVSADRWENTVYRYADELLTVPWSNNDSLLFKLFRLSADMPHCSLFKPARSE
jgi:hypothetical protein